jgi:hypothetical protein
MVHYRTDVSIIQASAIQGLLGCCLLFPTNLKKPYALAWLCGTFAGMSSHPGSSLTQATLLGLTCTGTFYSFERQQYAVGKGGRLGFIAFVSNIMYYLFLRKGGGGIQAFFSNVVMDTWNKLGMGGFTVQSITATTMAFLTSIVVLPTVRHHAKLTSTNKNSQETIRQITLLGIQSILLGILFQRLLSLKHIPMSNMVTTIATTFLSSIMVWKSPYTIATVTGLGILSSYWRSLMSSSIITGTTTSIMINPAAVYMGTFIGMCSLPGFRVFKFLLASTLSTLLLQFEILPGFGGRLGFLAYLGVQFAL